MVVFGCRWLVILTLLYTIVHMYKSDRRKKKNKNLLFELTS